MNRHYDMVVIGAGISGLAMAFEAKQAGKNVLVLEKEARSGGCFHSASVPDSEQNFWLEMGTHTCFNSYARLIKVLHQLGMIDQLQPRKKLRYRLFAERSICSIPSQLHFLELFTRAWRIFSLSKKDQSIAAYYSALVGPKNYNDVFKHAFAAVICQPASNVPADMLFRKRPRNKSITRSYTFPGGLSDIIQALEAQLLVKTDQCIQSVRYNYELYAVQTDETTYHCDTLVCATPALAASRLLMDAHPEIAEQLNWVNEVEIESVGVVINKEDLLLDSIAGVIAVDGDFYSAVSRDYIDHPDLRAFTFHFKPGLLNHDEKMLRICDVLNVSLSDFKHVFHKTNRLPAPDMGHLQLIEALDSALTDRSLALVGNYFNGVAVEDCLERVEKEFIRISQSA